ncbi:hypothetical protein FD13_GL001976 [Levilactobacillus senmaizukei DSM 21775 = NBRC 103853]|uniref:Flavodoxin-like domain-containing protein n=1 Tax=Levilactobacillus senmaizukei DSM 21775 = NBRC 103853 TaxID=1423803 RepID=A0A0R2DH23_9LACO|nr:flavodoxin [Levilactobacillus senmaizukei]KRN02299.1 hypothetical protein FD13_GL001976 [Levilactobacillus senmaizukei DSM 21775 = NBRC 103853]
MTAKTLILDYSWSGTTAKMATALQAVTGADKLDLTVASGTFGDTMNATADIANEQRSAGDFPTLTTSLPNLNDYQTLLIGGPVWSGKVSTPIRTLLNQLGDFSGVVAPFYTDAGTPGGYEDEFESRLTKAQFVPGIGMTAGDLRHADEQLVGWWRLFKIN